jgi:hypothetical protein
VALEELWALTLQGWVSIRARKIGRHESLSAYRLSSDHGQTQKSLVGKERGALRAFSLGRTVPASLQASAEERHGPLAMQVLFLVPHRR